MLADASKGSDEKYKAKMAVRKQIQVYEAERDSIINGIEKENKSAIDKYTSNIENIQRALEDLKHNLSFVEKCAKRMRA